MKKIIKNLTRLHRNKALFKLKQCLFFVLIFSGVYAQIPTNTWRTHADYFNARGLEIVEKNKIYCFSKNGFFFFDKTNNQTTTLSKLDNLSETSIAQIRYSSTLKTLLIAYQTGNLDFMSVNAEGKPDGIKNLNFIKNTDAIQGSKSINQIEFKDDFAYLAADFGLVLVDVKKQEIKETYQNLGKEGKKVGIKQLTFARDSIFLNTTDGILGAKFSNNINLQFYGNWKTIIDNQLFKAPVFPKDALIVSPIEQETDTEGKTWIADSQNGLISNLQGSFKTFSPNGVKGDIFSVYSQNQKIHASGIWGNTFNDNIWQNVALNQLPQNNKTITDTYGYRWQINGQILSVADPATNRLRYYTSSNELPSIYVNSIALDRDNLLWIGTTNGVAVIITSKDIFTTSTKPYTPFYKTRRLLLQEVVNKIVVDGGNRKWIATQNGLNLFSASADEQILNFTEENSPLFSKNVIDLALDPLSGELFVLTQEGLLSYRSDASDANENFSKIKIFPNPVRPEFSGELTITGLRENTNIKITDAAGRLIHETKSNGGTAIWNLQTPQGERASTGIYMILGVSEDGSEKFVGKFVVIK
ncbi:hypothetical protein Emtol_2349 [Emticicia oligotrophica DSM 17448]|uniref:PorZ N-terminal beta-propeller domain-containing protein n=1 Tax=Emticicia oligotrophica (strain DSM 17448 / CIP 109782 / MTCC 6937 / GPTSA100-15) TaxID=929562 RepID=A0ABM5N2B3_EMTOG|nr:T9SS type A sorting domain-containing protein [Emticicia oligotrophica]AFK03486.1 hypothetical protein Emtol_2349 [Emticicia oligotrophica DSM 17448]